MTNVPAQARYFDLIEATLRAGLAHRGGPRVDAIAGEVSVERVLPTVARHLGYSAEADFSDDLGSTTNFVDGAGNRRAIYAAIVAGTTRSPSIAAHVALAFGPLVASLADGSLTLDARHGTEVSVAALAARALARREVSGALTPRKIAISAIQRVASAQQADGTFLARTDADAPEPRWYDELAILHALSCFASEHDDEFVAAAVTRAVKYHAAETQPDHASNHPWAIAAFLAEPTAIPLADMMLHAAGVQSPRTMDAVSLLLLADALDCGRRRATTIMPAMPPENAESPIAISPELLKILRCPLTRSPLKVEGDRLVAERGGLRYPVRNGIPVLLVEEAELPAGVSSLDELKKQLSL